MTRPAAHPQSATHALALARIDDLRREAELDRLARTGRTPVSAPNRSGADCCA